MKNRIEYPRLVAIETTNFCNAKCTFCPNNNLKRDRAVMKDDLFEKIIRDCSKFELEAIEPFLQGEPFVDPRIFNRLELIQTLLPKTKLRLYSNGAALIPSKADRLREFKIDNLYISLNTPDPKRYREITGLPFEKTFENLKYLTSDHHKRPVARTINVRMTVTKETTWKERARFVGLCAKLRVRPMMVGLFNYKGDIHSNLPVPSFPCEHITRLDILVDGRTTLCCMDQEGEYGWGPVKEKSVLEVFNGSIASRAREMHRTGKRLQYYPCNQCNLFWTDFSRVHWARKIKFYTELVGYHLRYRPLW